MKPREKKPEIEMFGQIKIGSNVFVGINSILLPNINIGDNCIIGAGSIVTRDVPSNTIAVGSPAKVTKTTDKHFNSIKDRCTYIRDLPLRKKRQILLRKLGQKL